jgi:hypothetical protein
MCDKIILATICITHDDTVSLYNSTLSIAELIPICTNILAHKMGH